MHDTAFQRRIDETRQRAHGRWTEILRSLGVDERVLAKHNGPCPLCGGKDRFQYTDKFGEGNYHCRHCGAGGGFKLLQASLGLDFPAALNKVEACVGILAVSDPRGDRPAAEPAAGSPSAERMRSGQPVLLDRNVNTWLQDEDDYRMLRTLDGRVRAVLSARYRRLDNYDLAESVLPILQRLPGVRFESVELTDTRMYIKVVTPTLRHEMAPGDIVQAGVVVTNSEVGHGSLSVQPLLFRLRCLNGLIMPDYSLHKTHLGRSIANPAEAITVFKDDTLAADDKAFFLKARDVVEAAVSEATFRQIAQKMQKTLGIPLVGDPVRAVEVLANRHGLNDEERAGVLRNLIAEGDLTGYGLVNAVTHYSQEVEDYDRATEFEVLGGRLLEQTSAEWHFITEAG